jgi:septum formation protein
MVYTGVTLLYRRDGGQDILKKCFHEATRVIFFPMTEEEIRGYVATGDPLDKAGAYGIQGLCARYIRGIEGDYNNVVGLPVGRLYQEIKGWVFT